MQTSATEPEGKEARPPSWLGAPALNDDIISALLKQKENSSSEREREREAEAEEGSREIKKSKGVSEVSERAMNHRDIPGRVSEATAVWSWINTGPPKQRSLNTSQVRAQHRPSGEFKPMPSFVAKKTV
ncbi:hypothetical protein EYF80_039599 [Liparis tanakae]|uniref:Uncharacterized protein n=1 Tax=Liparis tanakae TaxID=230148 RepID=A0A4Z2GAR8_9TELE|nr:hypothetical protein EYF80_039599 [Liparis tanakae]